MKVGWYFHRLRAMTVSELAHRVTERWKHRADASFGEFLRGIKLGEAAEGVIALPERESAPEALKQTLARDAAELAPTMPAKAMSIIRSIPSNRRATSLDG